MTDIRDANPRTDGLEPHPGLLPFGRHPDDVPYDGEGFDDLIDGPWYAGDALDPDDEPPRRPLALEPWECAALAQAIDARLRDHGCDNTLGAAQAWARREKVRWGLLRTALEERGGFCDCEVLMNVLAPD